MCKTSSLLMPGDSSRKVFEMVCWAPPPMCLLSVWSWHHLISPAFPLCICMLQVIKDWRWEWPENEAHCIPLGALKAHVIGCYWGNTKYSLATLPMPFQSEEGAISNAPPTFPPVGELATNWTNTVSVSFPNWFRNLVSIAWSIWLQCCAHTTAYAVTSLP